MAQPLACFFDTHNHVHLSMPGKVPNFDGAGLNRVEGEIVRPPIADAVSDHAKNVAEFFSTRDETDTDEQNGEPILRGMALMSTQPRDFLAVDAVCEELGRESSSHGPMTSIPCYGVHPWFLHEAESDGAELCSIGGGDGDDDRGSFWWEDYLRRKLLERPDACVGEIGLDSARYDPATGRPHTPIERQVEAFEAQLRIATELRRPVVVHAVRAWGPLLDTLNRKFGKKRGDKPPRMYFHAFGGKPAVVGQVDAACRGTDDIIYGFAPCVNFRSPKTAEVIRRIGIDRLVLETDRENFRLVKEDLDANAEYIADALGMNKQEVVQQTTENAMRFYGIK